MTGDPNLERSGEPPAPSPTMVDFIETKLEQGGIATAIMGIGVFAALVIFVFGVAFGIATVAGVIALTIVFAALFIATFVGHDTNYMVRRMRERAKDRDER